MNNYDFNPDEIFGIREAGAASRIKGMELRYESEHGKPESPDYLREQVHRSKTGRYYMSVKCGSNASYFQYSPYDFAGREVFFPVAPEALAGWAGRHLQGGDCTRAKKEFISSVRIGKKVWEYLQGADNTQPGFIQEYLCKTNTDTYALFSTDCSYPYFGCNAAMVKGNRTVHSDLYLYYITVDTAQRWAKARGMDGYTYKEVFGRIR